MKKFIKRLFRLILRVARDFSKRSLRLLLPERLYDWLHIQTSHLVCSHRFASFRHPTYFNEKVKYRMYWDRRPILTRLADKIAARDYVAERVGPQYLTTLYTVTRDPASIDFAALPQSYVIKPNHCTQKYILVRDKNELDTTSTVNICHRWLKKNLYYSHSEHQYRYIVPQILIEEYLTDDYLGVDKDVEFKCFVFDGEPKFLAVIIHIGTMRYLNLYWPDWRPIPAIGKYQLFYPNSIAAPARLAEMFDLCRQLTAGIDFVRLDLKLVGNRILFREFTFSPTAGKWPYWPRRYELLFGSFWKLPHRRVLGSNTA